MLLKKAVLGAVAVAAFATSAAFATVPAQTNACNYQFATNLRLGAVSSDVQNLQKLLNMDAATRVAASGAGSMGNETFRFGPATLAAVKKFQAANGISPVSGYVGPLTRGVLNTICSSTVSTTPTNTNTGSGVVANNIPVSVLVEGQAGAKLAEFVVSGNGVVTGIELMRTGLSNNETLRNVYLYDGVNRLTDGASVLIDGTIRFTNSSGLFPVSGSKTVTVMADICKNGLSGCGTQSTSGQTIGVAMKSVTMMGGTSTPVTGANGPLFSISSASLASITVTNNQANSNQNVNSGTVNQNVWDTTINVGTRAVKLKNMTFRYTGSAPVDAIGNIGLFVDGVKVGSGVIGSNNLLTIVPDGGMFMMNTGNRQVQLRGDFVKGASRTAQFYVQNAVDMLLEDSTLPGVSIGTNVSNVYGYNFQIQQGTLTVNQDPMYTTTTVVGGGTNVTIGKMELKAFGEDVKVETLAITPVEVAAFTGYSSGYKLPNVTVYVNGGQIGTSQNWTSGALTFNLGSSLIVPAGGKSVIEIKADLKDQNSNNYTGGQVRADVTLGSTVARGQNSFNSITPTGSGTGKTLTINTSNATFAKTGGFTAQTVSPNATGVKIGSFTVSNGDNEDIRVTNIAVTLTLGAGMTISNVTNMRLSDSSVIIGQPVTGSNANNYTLDVIVPRNTTKVFDITADLGSAAGTTATVQADAAISFRGVSSAIATNNSAASPNGVSMTAQTATLIAANFTLDSSSPVTQVVVGGATNAIANFKIVSTSSPATIQKMTFTVADSIDRITAIKVGGQTKAVTGLTGNQVTGLNIQIPTGNSGVIVPVEVVYGNVNSNGGVTSQTSAASSITLTAVEYVSGNSVSNVTGLTVASANMQLTASKPSLTSNTSNVGGLGIGEIKIGEFTISADAKGNVVLNQINLDVTASGITGFGLSGCKIVEGTSGSIAVTNSTTTCSTTQADFGFGANGYTIQAGTSKTFSVYGTVAGTLGNSGTSAVSTKLEVGSTGLIWADVVGGGAGLTGANIYNYPTGSYTVKN